MTQELKLYDTVEAIAAQFERRQAEIVKAQTVADECRVELKEDYSTLHKREAWEEIIKKSNCRQWMDSKTEKEMHDLLWNKPQALPEITVEGLRAWLQSLIVSTPQTIRQLCREAFEILTPQARHFGKDYKSNEDKREIPKSGRVVLTYMCETATYNKTPRLAYSAGQKINILDRVFSLLKGCPMPEGEETTENKCRKAYDNKENEVVCFWGHLKMHLNGNLHIWLTDAGLIRKLTETASGDTLQAAREA